MKSEQRQLPSYPLRLEPETRAKLEAIAKANGRSLHAEISMRLEASLQIYSEPSRGNEERRELDDELVKIQNFTAHKMNEMESIRQELVQQFHELKMKQHDFELQQKAIQQKLNVLTKSG